MFFQLSLFSRYRAELMGASAVLIILCHMPAHNVAMPSTMARIISYGGLGCDVFLFLSGMGLWFSLNNEYRARRGIGKWLKWRYIRVLVPYLLLVVPVFAIKAILDDWSFRTYVWRLSTLSFWTEGWGAWFISLVLILYAVTPWLYKRLSGCGKWIWLMIFVLFTWASGAIPHLSEPWNNIQFGVCRIPCFLIGLAMADDVKKGTKVSLIKLFFPLFFFLLIGMTIKLFTSIPISMFWIEGMILLILLALIINFLGRYQWLMRVLAFMGSISLESYCTNVFVLSFFLFIPWSIGNINLNPGNWTYYVSGTFFCILLSIFVHKLSGRVVAHLNK